MTRSEKTEHIGKFLSQPRHLKKEFVVSKYTYEDIYKLAAGFCEVFSEKDVVCLAAEDKGMIAASVLASLVCNTVLVLPYSYSENVLKELREEIGFTKAVSDHSAPFPSDVEILTPGPRDNYLSFSESLKSANDPDREFLKLFTGGSTGKSKLWSKTYRNLFGESLYLSEKFNISDNDLILATVPPYHIYGLLFSVLLPLVSSASVMPDVCVFPGEILSAVRKNSPTVLVSIPIHYKALNQSSMDHPLSIKTAFSSAAPLHKSDSIDFYKKTGIGITEIYGSTETGGIAARCQAHEDAFKPFDNIGWKIQNERLCVRSDFISPVLPKDADDFFMTGDRVSSQDNERFILIGRSDDIVKIAGKRVDLKEIQHKLMQIEGVRQVIVYAIPGDRGRENEIVALAEGDTDEAEIRKSACKILEPYAVPRYISVSDKIPVSPTGKFIKSSRKENN